MSRIAQKEDLSRRRRDRRPSRAWWARARRLTALYLLTVADIRGTSPKVWNAWKGKLLEDLYRLTLRALGGAKPNLDAEIEARKQEARQLLALHSALPGTEEPLWKTLDVSYFARHDAADIAWHARSLWRHVRHARCRWCGRAPSSVGEGLQVLVYSPDRPDLFARICGYFDSAGFSIQDAKIHTTRAGYALDTFQVISTALRAGRPGGLPRPDLAGGNPGWRWRWRPSGPLPEPGRGRVSRRVQVVPGHAARHAAARRARAALAARASAPATAPACSTPSPACWRATRSTCSWPRSARWASGWRTPSWSTARRCSITRTQLQIESELLDAVAPA